MRWSIRIKMTPCDFSFLRRWSVDQQGSPFLENYQLVIRFVEIPFNLCLDIWFIPWHNDRSALKRSSNVMLIIRCWFLERIMNCSSASATWIQLDLNWNEFTDWTESLSSSSSHLSHTLTPCGLRFCLIASRLFNDFRCAQKSHSSVSLFNSFHLICRNANTKK